VYYFFILETASDLVNTAEQKSLDEDETAPPNYIAATNTTATVPPPECSAYTELRPLAAPYPVINSNQTTAAVVTHQVNHIC